MVAAALGRSHGRHFCGMDNLPVFGQPAVALAPKVEYLERMIAPTRKRDGFAGERIFVLQPETLERASRHPLLAQLRVTDAGHFPTARYHYRGRAYGCDQHILIYCDKGRGFASVAGNEPFEIRPHTFVIIPALTPHTYGADPTEPWTIYWSHFVGDASFFYFSHLPITDRTFSVEQERLPFVRGLFEELLTLLKRGYSTEHLIACSQIMAGILGTLIFNNRDIEIHINDRSHVKVEHVIDHMRHHLQEPLRLGDLAAKVGLSVSQLSWLFRRETGYPPMKYLARLKIQRACRYLESTDASISAISEQLGFEDPFYFSRLFKKTIGCSPLSYRTGGDRKALRTG